ncbi:MAG: hypothetical protein J6O41_01905 [Clostridia bacterium]|nr:hypothetical protein [Clostridia bacterium]
MCEYCNANYKVLNKTKEYSDIEISLYTAIRGIRVRAIFDERGLFKTQDVININYCPMCGRKLGE